MMIYCLDIRNRFLMSLSTRHHINNQHWFGLFCNTSWSLLDDFNFTFNCHLLTAKCGTKKLTAIFFIQQLGQITWFYLKSSNFCYTVLWRQAIMYCSFCQANIHGMARACYLGKFRLMCNWVKCFGRSKVNWNNINHWKWIWIYFWSPKTLYSIAHEPDLLSSKQE